MNKSSLVQYSKIVTNLFPFRKFFKSDLEVLAFWVLYYSIHPYLFPNSLHEFSSNHALRK